MKLRDYFNEVICYLKSQKIKVSLLIAFFTLLFLVFNILIQVSANFTQLFNDYTKNYSEARSLFVYKDINYSNIVSDLINREHIAIVYNQDYNMATGYLNIDNKKIYVNIKPLNNIYSPKIISGRKVNDSNEMICPKYLAKNISDLTTISDVINMKDYVDKELNLSYKKEIFRDLYTIDTIKKYSRKIKIVGLYDDGYSTGMFYDCYMLDETLKEIVEEERIVYSDEYLSQVKVEENGLSTSVVVDKLENVDTVSKQLKEDGYIVERQLAIKTELLENINLISKILTVIMFLFISIIFVIYLGNMIKKQKRDIGLYKLFGFTNRQITNIIIFKVLTIIILSIVLEGVIIMFLLEKANLEIDKILNYAYIDLKLFLVPQFIFIVFIIMLIILISRLVINKVCKLEVGNILNENNL